MTSGETSRAIPDEILHHAEELEILLSSSDRVEERVLAILDRRLARAINEDTLGELFTTFADYFGDAGTTFVGLLITELDDPNYAHLAEIAPLLSDVRRTAKAIYGGDLDTALALWDERADDWRRIPEEIYKDAESDTYVIRLLIEKYNGDTMSVVGNLTSVIRLARRVMNVLNDIPDPTAFRDDETKIAVGELLEQIHQFVNSVRGTSSAEEAKEAEGAQARNE